MAEIMKKYTVILESSNGEIFEVDELVASQSQVIKNVIEDVGIDHSIPLVKVSSSVLSKVIEYCKCHAKNKMDSIEKMFILNDEMKTWDGNFLKVGFTNLNDMILAANYLHIESLEDYLCQILAKIITKKKHEEIRQIFNIWNQFTNEKNGEIHRKNQLQHFFVFTFSNELQYKIKLKVGQNFHLGMWSAWRYDGKTRTLIVGLGKLHLTCKRDQQIDDIILLVDIGLVNILVLQTRIKCSIAPHKSGRERLYWIDQLDLNLFKNLVDYIDMLKVEKLIVDDESVDPELEND